MIRRVAVLGFLAFSGFMALSCSDRPIESPMEPQFAKGGEPAPKEPQLLEFWVVPGETSDDPDTLHIVWSGGGTAVNPSVVWDYFFNGIRDDNVPVSDHYEYQTLGPPLTEGVPFGDGLFHADIPFDGTRTNGGYPYPDFLATEFLDEGDPFAFWLGFYDNRGTRVGAAQPFGVVVGGINEFGVILPEATVTSVVEEGHDGNVDVRSFATFKGVPRKGTISITELSMTSLSCEVRTVTTGRGNNKTTSQQTLVSGDVTVTFAKDEPITLVYGEYIWWEGHFLNEDKGAFSARVSGNGSSTFSISETMPPGWINGSVSFVIDYVVSSAWTGSTDEDHSTASYYVYDPSANTVTTTAGFSQIPWGNGTGPNPNSEVNKGKFPVAHTESFSVNCG